MQNLVFVDVCYFSAQPLLPTSKHFLFLVAVSLAEMGLRLLFHSGILFRTVALKKWLPNLNGPFFTLTYSFKYWLYRGLEHAMEEGDGDAARTSQLDYNVHYQGKEKCV